MRQAFGINSYKTIFLLMILTSGTIFAIYTVPVHALDEPVLSKTSGYVGDDDLVVNGTGAAPFALVEIYWDSIEPNNLLNSTIADVTGYYETNAGDFKVPEDCAGQHWIIVVDGVTFNNGTQFTIIPNIELDPEEGLPDDRVDVIGTGFGDEYEVTIFFDWGGFYEEDVTQGTPDTDENGSLSTHFYVPDVDEGDRPLEATIYANDSDGNSASATFTVLSEPSVYIRADGSVDPPTTPISSVDNVTYTFTANIYTEIFVERDNIVVDGAGFLVQGTGSGTGIDLRYRNNVTLKNVEVTDFYCGIYLGSSNNNTLIGNNASNNFVGIYLGSSNNNTLIGNNASNNYNGIILFYSSNYNVLFHNNLINNTAQASIITGYVNTWDDGYPSGGNYWSDYTGVDLYCGPYQNETGSDGIGDTPYVINADNIDNYPLVEPWSPEPPSPREALEELVEIIETWNLPKGIERSLTYKAEGVLRLLDKGNENGAIHLLRAFINEVEVLREKKLTSTQADFLISEAHRIIDLIKG